MKSSAACRRRKASCTFRPRLRFRFWAITKICATLLEQRCADIVILADLYMNMGEIIGLANLCEKEFAQFKIIPSYFQILASGLRLETISGVPVLGRERTAAGSFYQPPFETVR